MKLTKFLFFFILSFSLNAEENLEGLWEGYALRGGMHGSHILQVNSEGKGFYTYTIGVAKEKELVFPVDLSKVKFNDGYLALKLKHIDSKIDHTLIISKDIGGLLSVLTIAHAADGKPLFSFPWALTKVRGDIRNKLLYDFAIEIYNESKQ